MVKKDYKKGERKKFRFRKRYLLLLILVILVILAFCWCGRDGIISGDAGILVNDISLQGDANQTVVTLTLTEGAMPEVQWKILSAGENTYGVQGVGPDPALGAYAVELLISGTTFDQAVLDQFGLKTRSLRQLGYETMAEAIRLATVEGQDTAVVYLGFSQPGEVTVDQKEGMVVLTLAAKKK